MELDCCVTVKYREEFILLNVHVYQCKIVMQHKLAVVYQSARASKRVTGSAPT